VIARDGVAASCEAALGDDAHNVSGPCGSGKH